jgi:hypothetical protein
MKRIKGFGIAMTLFMALIAISVFVGIAGVGLVIAQNSPVVNNELQNQITYLHTLHSSIFYRYL